MKREKLYDSLTNVDDDLVAEADGHSFRRKKRFRLLGSIAAFTLYFSGVRRIGPGKGSMISAIEPVSAAVFGVLWLGNIMTVHDLIGFACILTMVVLLARSKD